MRLLAARSAVILSSVLVCAPTLAAPAELRPDAPNPAEKVRKDLSRPVTLKIDNKPLGAAVDALRAATHMNLVLDSVTIQQQLSIAPDQSEPLSLDLKDVPARTALREILAPFGLTYVIIDDAVIVTTDDMAMLRQMRQRVNVDMDGVDLGAALRQVAREAGVNVLLDARADKDAEAKVTMHLEDVPLETAVRLLSEMAGLKPVRVGNVLFVTSKDNANELRQDPDLSQPPQPLPILKDK